MLTKTSTEALKAWKLANNISNIDFPATDYSSFLATFVDDLGIYSPKTLPSTYKEKYTPTQYHLLATDTVFFCLHTFGWKISLRKSTVMKSRFTFLGMEWDMDHQQMGINSDRLSSILSWRCPRSIP